MSLPASPFPAIIEAAITIAAADWSASSVQKGREFLTRMSRHEATLRNQIYCAARELAEDQAFAEAKHPKDWGTAQSVATPAPFDMMVEKGQVRLMAAPEEILHVLVVGPWGDDDHWLIAPFSKLSLPVNCADLYLRDSYARGVLRGEFRTWSSKTLTQSWVVETLDADSLADVHALLRYALEGTPLPPKVLVRTALPICRESDPRCPVIDRERILVEQLDGADWERERK